MQHRIIGAAAGAATLAAGVLALASPASAATSAAAPSQVAATSQTAATSQVYVVHGIPGQPVDVYVNGDRALENFEPTKVAGPLELPEGSYDIALTQPGEPIEEAIIEVNDAAVPGGANISLVAHFSAQGAPTLTPFVNDTSQIEAGNARLIVRHTAAAPAVDVRAGGEPVFPGLSNPNEAKADLPAGTVSADVALAGTDTVALGPADLELAEGSATIVYAIGSAEQPATLGITSQVLNGLDSAPGGVPAGSGGLADDGMPSWWYAVAGAGALTLLGGVALATRRVRAAPRS
jgi:hypothetical protein